MREIAYVPTHLKQSLIFICFPLTVTARVKEKGKEKVSETRTSTLKLNIEKSKNRRREEGRSIGPSVASSFRAGWLKSSLAYLDPSSCRYESDPLGKGRRRGKQKRTKKQFFSHRSHRIHGTEVLQSHLSLFLFQELPNLVILLFSPYIV